MRFKWLATAGLRGQTDWGAVMATSVIYTLPVVALFALLRRHLVTGLTSGALKG